eukprot:scaffold795_cov115-Isochrysis_galbana.AAC.8
MSAPFLHRLTYFLGFSMELLPADDARAAPSACAPTTLSMAMPLPTTYPRSPSAAQGRARW